MRPRRHLEAMRVTLAGALYRGGSRRSPARQDATTGDATAARSGEAQGDRQDRWPAAERHALERAQHGGRDGHQPPACSASGLRASNRIGRACPQQPDRWSGAKRASSASMLPSGRGVQRSNSYLLASAGPLVEGGQLLRAEAGSELGISLNNSRSRFPALLPVGSSPCNRISAARTCASAHAISKISRQGTQNRLNITNPSR
jgi:hypothetical protein